MKHLFILCYGRTGSTVVQGLLNRLDGYCIRGERKAVLASLAKAASFGFREKESFSKSDLKGGVISPHFGVSETQPERFASDLAALYTRDMLTPPEGTRVCGTKDISMSTNWITDKEFDFAIDFIFNQFAGSRIIFLTRDVNEVAKSGWWAGMDEKKVRDNITQTDARFTRACEAHPDRTFTLDYSEFKDGVAGFRRLLTWLEEPIDEAVLEEISAKRLMHLKGNWSPKNQPRLTIPQRAKRKAKHIAKRVLTRFQS